MSTIYKPGPARQAFADSRAVRISGKRFGYHSGYHFIKFAMTSCFRPSLLQALEASYAPEASQDLVAWRMKTEEEMARALEARRL